MVIGWNIGNAVTDGDEEFRCDDERGKTFGNEFVHGVKDALAVVVVWTIVDEAFRTFDVLNVRVTITGVEPVEIEFEESEDEEEKRTSRKKQNVSFYFAHWNLLLLIRWRKMFPKWKSNFENETENSDHADKITATRSVFTQRLS